MIFRNKRRVRHFVSHVEHEIFLRKELLANRTYHSDREVLDIHAEEHLNCTWVKFRTLHVYETLVMRNPVLRCLLQEQHRNVDSH